MKFQDLLCYYFAVNLAIISLALLISSFSMIIKATGITLIIFFVAPLCIMEILMNTILYRAPSNFLSVFLSAMNPHLIRFCWGKYAMQIRPNEPEHGDLIALASSIVYLCLYIFFEWVLIFIFSENN